MSNALVLSQLLLGLIDRQAQIATLLTKAHAEGRDVSAEELEQLFSADLAARADLEAAIAARRAG